MLRRYSMTGLETLYLSPKITTIGSGSCDLCIEGQGVDVQHGVIEYNPVTRSYWIKDLGSQLGTQLNGYPIFGSHELKEGDQLAFGYSKIYLFETPTVALSSRLVAQKARTGNTPRLPNLNENPRRPPSPAKLIPLERAENVAMLQNRNRKWAEYRQKTQNRGGSLDRMRTRRKVIANAWTNDKVAYSVTSPSSSASSWEGQQQIGAVRPENQGQLIRQLQNRISQLEKLLKVTSAQETNIRTDNNIINTRNGSNYLLERVVRLQTEITKKDLELQAIKSQTELPQTDYNLQYLEKVLEKSETEKDDLKTDLEQTEDLLQDREQTISQLVELKMEREREDVGTQSLETSLGSGGPQWKVMDDDFLAQSMKSTKLLCETNIALDVYRTFLTVLLEDMTNLCIYLSEISSMEEIHNIIVERCLQSPQDKLAVFETKSRQILLTTGYRSRTDSVDQQLREANSKHWQPIAEQIGIIARIVRDACLGEIHSKKASAAFIEWSEKFKNELEQNGLTSEGLFDYSVTLGEQMTNIGATDHWVTVNLQPILRMAANIVRTEIETKLNNRFDGFMNTEITLDDIEAYKHNMEVLQQEMDRKAEEAIQLRHELTDVKTDNSRLAAKTTEMEAEIIRLRQDVADLENKCVDLVHESTTLKLTKEQLDMDRMQLQTESGLQKEKLKILENESFENKQDCTTTKAEFERLKADYGELHSKYKLKETEVEQLRDIRKTPQQMEQQDDNKWQSLISAREEEVSQLKQTIQEREKEVFDVQEKMLDFEKSKSELINQLRVEQSLNDGMNKTESTYFMSANVADSKSVEMNSTRSEDLRYALDNSEKSFWELSQRLAGMLDVDLRRNETPLNTSGSGFETTQQSTVEKEDRGQAAEELARGVQELLERVRRQNDELTTYRSPDETTSSRCSTATVNGHVPENRNNGERSTTTTPKGSGRKVNVVCKIGCTCSCHVPRFRSNFSKISSKMVKAPKYKCRNVKTGVKGLTKPKQRIKRRTISAHKQKKFRRNLWKAKKAERAFRSDRKKKILQFRYPR